MSKKIDDNQAQQMAQVAFQRGVKQGAQQGAQQGVQQGLQQGIQQGLAQAQQQGGGQQGFGISGGPAFRGFQSGPPQIQIPQQGQQNAFQTVA